MPASAAANPRRLSMWMPQPCCKNCMNGASTPYDAVLMVPGSEELGALPVLAQDVLGQEGEDGLVPDLGVARGEDPVVLVREVEELGLGAVLGQVPPQPQRLAHRHPVVLVPVDDQHRRADLRDVAVR